jgi:nucleoside diphosphate kinase
MAVELSFVLINPYTISKSRTGVVISRLISRTGLELVGARMYGPSRTLAEEYAEVMRTASDVGPEERDILADYILTHYAPDPATGKARRAMMLLFEGEDAIAKVKLACGPLRRSSESGLTVRDTFGDFITDEQGRVRYVEPAVMMGRTRDTVQRVLRLWADHSGTEGGLLDRACDTHAGADVHKTLVIIKPDNFRFPSARPGNIIDLFSGSGLRIIGAKVHRMSVAEAEEFYGPVREVLRTKMAAAAGERSAQALARAFELDVPADVARQLGQLMGPVVGDHQFYNIIQFMTGYARGEITPAIRNEPGKVRCLALVYSGPGAVDKIRGILGPTDPSKAQPGSVRREFGTDIMVNAAHASDSPENAGREMEIIKIGQDVIQPLVRFYYP